MKTEKEIKTVSRKKFVLWSVAAVSVLSAAKFLFRFHSKRDRVTMKMLTQDGKLVEVEISKLSSKRKKINEADIHTWVQRKSPLKF